MKWATYKVVVRYSAPDSTLKPNKIESEVKVQAVSKADAKWRAVNKRLDSRYEAISAEKLE